MPKTIHEYPLALTALPTAEFLMWDAENNVTNRIAKANMLGGNITGGGTIATGGYTGTLPASGTLAMRSVAQNWSALQTFGAGISFGQDVLNYYDEGTFVPEIWDAPTGGSKGTITTAIAYWTRLGNRVDIDFTLIFIGTTGMTGANAVYIRNIPFTASPAASYRAWGNVNAISVNFGSGYLTPFWAGNTNYITFRKSVTGAAAASLIVSEVIFGLAQLSFSIRVKI